MLNQKIAKNIEIILDNLNLEYTVTSKRIYLSCPIHNGDNEEACSIYYDCEYPFWKCFTHGCHHDGKGLFNFVKKTLGLSSRETIIWLENIIGKIEKVDIDRNKFFFINENRKFSEHKNKPIMSREEFLSKINYPSEYFISRGYSPEILSKYDCGTWKVTNKPVIPIYDNERKFVVGYIERTIHKKCCLCDTYHDFSKPCPVTKPEKAKCRKWKNSFGFYSENTFYNIWFAKEEIIRSKTAVLVEGQGDVWSLEEAGIKNSLGLFGVELKKGQKQILDNLGVQNIILFLDPDCAGEEATNKIKKSLGRYYNFYEINSEDDPGDCSSDFIRSQFSLLGV